MQLVQEAKAPKCYLEVAHGRAIGSTGRAMLSGCLFGFELLEARAVSSRQGLCLYF